MSIEQNIENLNKIQERAFTGHKLDPNERNEWAFNVLAVKSAGYVLKKKRIKNSYGKSIGIIWYATTPRKCTFAAPLVKVDMRPKDGKPFCKTDCTTRAMAYVLKGAASYREIEKEQYRKAEEKNREMGIHWGDYRSKYHRNTDGIWDKVILEFGYIWVKLYRRIRRDKLAKLLANIENPIITESANHVAIIERGNVIDTWDSRRGMCGRILVSVNDVQKVRKYI